MTFSHATKVEVARLDPREPDGLKKFFWRKFHGRVLASDWRTLDVTAAAQLVKILQHSLQDWINVYSAPGDGDRIVLSTFCVPHPGYAIRLQTESGTRDFLVCFECRKIIAYDGRKKSVLYSVPEDACADMRARYDEEFPSQPKVSRNFTAQRGRR